MFVDDDTFGYTYAEQDDVDRIIGLLLMGLVAFTVCSVIVMITFIQLKGGMN